MGNSISPFLVDFSCLIQKKYPDKKVLHENARSQCILFMACPVLGEGGGTPVPAGGTPVLAGGTQSGASDGMDLRPEAGIPP